MINKTFSQEQLDQAKARLKIFKEKGLDTYEEHKDLVIEMIQKKLEEDIKYFEEKLSLEKENTYLNSSNINK